jgi:hypothetical protein
VAPQVAATGTPASKKRAAAAGLNREKLADMTTPDDRASDDHRAELIRQTAELKDVAGLGTLMAAKDAKLAAPLQKLLDEGAATDQFTISDSRDAANAILGAAMIATLTRWEDGRDTQDPEFQQALTDQLVRSVARA